jgi:hypothetical protein
MIRFGAEMNRYRLVAQTTGASFEDDSFSVLDWWRVNRHDLPMLSRVARAYLAIQPTSAASERVFSRAGIVISDLRNRLVPSLSGDLTFCHCNPPLLDLFDQ